MNYLCEIQKRIKTLKGLKSKVKNYMSNTKQNKSGFNNTKQIPIQKSLLEIYANIARDQII